MSTFELTRYRRIPRRWICGMILMAGLGIVPALSGCDPAQPESPVVAIVNGRPITLAEFDMRWAELSGPVRERYEADGGKRQFLDELISRELLMQEARKRGLHKSPGVRHRMQRYQEQLLLDKVMREAVKAQVEIGQDELESYYASHGAVLPAPDRIEVSQIVSNNIYAAKDIKRMLDEGIPFPTLAKRYSADRYTKNNGGYVGLYQKGSAPAEVEEVIYRLRPGRTSSPIKTEAGFYIVKVLSRKPGDTQEVLAARERLKQELYAEKSRKQLESYLANLKGTATIRIGDASKYVTENLNSVRRVSRP